MSPLALPDTAALPSEAEAGDLLGRALARGSAEHLEAGLEASSGGSTRFSEIGRAHV